MPFVRRRLPHSLQSVFVAVLPALLIVVGTLGYHTIEDWPLFDALYMTVITLTTVGYREVHELSRAGQVFTMLLALGGVFTLFYAASIILGAVLRVDLLDFLGNRRMERSLNELNDHLIVCGFGRMGRLVCEQLAAHNSRFVVVDRDAASLERFSFPTGVALHGDATSDEVLEQAGVRRARAVISVAASDADNLYITMSARLLNERVFIVARAEDERSEQKLLRAGANRVVSPYLIGGARVAQAVLRPNVVDFLELATRGEHLELNIEEAVVRAGSRLAGQSLASSQPDHQRVIVVAVKQAAGKMLFNPDPQHVLSPGDVLIMLGGRRDLDALAALAAGNR